jgi:TP901 family phage tail tape measure protein
MANIIDILIRAQDQASDQIKKVEAASDQLGQSMTPVTNALKVAGVATLALGAASIKMAGDYEQGLAIFKSVSGATAEQMALVSEKARQLGKDASLPGISAADAAGAMTELAKAGLDVNQTLAASKGVLSLAKAGQIEVADAALIASQALNAFKLEGSDAARVADILANGANASAADMRGLSLGLQQSAAVAGQFGVSLEDTVTTLGLFANRGLQGSDAGTSLKTMLISLANPSKQAAATMQELGLQAYDAQGKFVGMRQFALNLQGSLKGLTQEQQNAALATIFGTDAFRAASFLADSAGASYDKMAGSIGKAGAAQDLAAAQNAGFKGALDNLLSTLETVGTDIGMKLLPPLTEFLKKLAASGVFDAFVKNLDLILVAVGTLGTMFAAFKIITFVQGVMAAVAAIKAATGATTLFNAVLALNPIMLIVMAVIALIGILVYLQVKFDIFGKLFKWLGDVGKAAWDGIKEGARVVGEFIGGVWDGIKAGAKLLFDAVVGYVMFWFNIYKTIFDAILMVATTVWNAIWNAVIKPIIDFIVGYFTVMWNIWSYIMQWIIALAMYAWNFIWGSVIKPVIDFIVGGMQWLGGIIAEVWNAISAAASAVWNWIWTNIIKPVLDAIVAGAQWLGGVVAGVWNGIVGAATWAWNGIKGAAQGVWNWLTGLFSGIGNFFAGVWQGMVNALSGPANAIKSTFDSIVGAITGGVKGAINWVIDRINDMIGMVNSVADKIPGAPKLGKLNRLASGANNYGGGTTLVGERGPEIVDLPKGSNVYSATQSANALRNANGGGGVTIEKLEVNNNVDVGMVIRQIGWELATQ